MRQAVRLDGVEALEEQHRLDETLAGRVAIDDGDEVDAEDVAELGLGGERVVEGEPDHLGRHRAVVEPVGDAADDRRLERRLVENGGVEEAAERRLGADHRLGLGADAVPDGVVDCEHRLARAAGIERHRQLPSATSCGPSRTT